MVKTNKTNPLLSGSLAKRPRTTNFATIEEEELVRLVVERKKVIENKLSDAVTNQCKKAAWEEIAALFNSTAPNLEVFSHFVWI